jgi:4-amino-4-deoxy-L-arabinose transferase-like glycosyltransferase
VLAATHRWARATWGVSAARWSVVVLATGGEFLALGRFVSLDMLLTCWVTLGILAGDRWLRTDDARTPWSVGVWIGLGLLTKGLVAPLFIGGIVVLTALATGRSARLRLRPLLGVAAVALVVAAPWYVAAGWLDPVYVRTFLLEHHFQRFLAAPHHMHPKPFWFPAAMLLVGFLPWTLLAPVLAVQLAREDRWDAGTRLCLLWIVCVVGFFTCSSGKLGTYVLPALVPLALLAGRGIARALATESAAVRATLGLAAAGVAGAVVAVPWLPHGAGFVPVARLVGPVLAACLAWGAWRGTVRHAGVAVGAVGAVVGLTYFVVLAPVIAPLVSDTPLVPAIAICDPDGRAEVIALGVVPSSLAFGVGRPIRRVDQVRRIRRALTRNVPLLVLASEEQAERLERLVGLTPVATARHVLLGPEECLTALGRHHPPRTLVRDQGAGAG